MATEKQIRFALHFLAKNGYPTKYMSSQFRTLGATMRERNGTVENWLSAMNSGQISQLINALK